MNPYDAIDVSREALLSGFLTLLPLLLAGLAIALAIGFLQSIFQIQEQSVAVIPKLVVMLALLMLSIPWMSQRFTDLYQAYLSKPLLISAHPIEHP